VIEQQIQAAQGRIGQTSMDTRPVAAELEGAVQTAASGQGIKVSVALDSALSARVDPGDTLFIFARPVKGARMPLAIVRKQASDLPLTVTLDDSMAMTPAMVLSKFDQVTIGARISKSGQAMPASGDLQGLVSPVNTLSEGNIELVIDQVVP